jgi:hypothetical protein
MTAKEKAQQLLYKYYVLAESIEWSDKDTKKKAEKYNDDLGEDVEYYWHELAKRSALIALDEILDVLEIPEQNIEREYWHEVEHEINQL